MERFVKGDVVVTNFPFSDLTSTIKRPALVTANLKGDDLILCEITTKEREDPDRIILNPRDLELGNLKTNSFIRPNRLFTLRKSVILYKFGNINKNKRGREKDSGNIYKMIELERTFLAKRIPDGLKNCKSKEIIDIYIPLSEEHPKLRIRKNGDKFEMTKKQPVNGNDSSKQKEDTIILNEKEFNSLSELDGKKLHKIRYYYDYNGIVAEVDVFLDELKGLILVDFEFEKEEEKNNFKMPDFCLADVTQDVFCAGGILCGKNYKDIEKDLNKYKYKKLIFET